MNKVEKQEVYNPWVFEDRLNLYSILINSTNIPIFGNDNLNNCLHGLQIQLEWQNRSGRLEIQNQDNINIKAWWGNMNYYLSVIPFISAMHNGLVPNITILPISNGDTRFCTTYSSCDQDIMNLWDNFFETIISIRNNGSTGNDDQLLKLMWDAHIGSIGKADTLFSDILDLLPTKEKKFGNGWAHFVDIIAVVNFNTNFSQVTTLGKSLPPQMLNDTDNPPHISSFTKDQNNIVMAMFEIDELSKNQLVWESFMSLLKKMMHTEQCREFVNREINSFINSPTSTIIKILIDVLTNNC